MRDRQCVPEDLVAGQPTVHLLADGRLEAPPEVLKRERRLTAMPGFD